MTSTNPTRTVRTARARGVVSALTAYAALDDQGTPTSARWAGVIGMEGLATGDGRFIEPGALSWAVGATEEGGAPRRIPFRDVESDVGEHAGAVIAGSIDVIERREGGVIFAEGDFDLTTEAGLAAFRSVESGRKVGVSMDLDSVSFEIRVAQEVIDEQEVILESILDEDEEVTEKPEREVDENGRVTVAGMNADDEMMVTTSARIRAATLVAIPAFDEASISVTDVRYDSDSDAPTEADDDSRERAENSTEPNDLTASGAPASPPSSWFEQPRLNGPTPITVTDEGHIYGHIATWETCHTANPAGAGVCVTPPASNTGYARYHTGSVKTREGDVISTGRITMSTKHASPQMSAQAASDHYDHSGAAVADVRAFEDSYGIVVAGALRPGVTDEQIRELRGSPMSGDWRRVDGSLELHAVLAVNVPGFPIPRPQGLVASGHLESLVASGMLAPVEQPETTSGVTSALSASDVNYLKRLADRERLSDAQALSKRVTRVKARMAADAVERFATTRYNK